MDQIHPGIYVENGFSGVTVGAVVGEAGVTSVDVPTLPEDATKWQRKLEQLNNRPILHIVNTDHHRDRVLCNKLLQVPVISHQETRQLIRGYPDLWRTAKRQDGRTPQSTPVTVGARSSLPEVTFTTKMLLGCGEVDMHLLHCPGSAPGATWVWVPEAKVIFTGDSVFQDTHPFLSSAQLDDWLDSLTHLRGAKFRDHIIVPGRSGPTDQDGLQFSLDYLRYLRRRLNAWREQGVPTKDASRLSGALLERFPVPDDSKDQMEKRLQAGLQHVFETLRT